MTMMIERGGNKLEYINIHYIKLYAIRINNPAEFYNTYCISEEDKRALKIYDDNYEYNMVVVDISTDIHETMIETKNMKSIRKDRVRSEYIKVAMQEIRNVQIFVDSDDVDSIMSDIFTHIVNMSDNNLSVDIDDYVYTGNIINGISISMSFRETIYCGLSITNMTHIQEYMYDHGFLENKKTMYEMISSIPILDIKTICIIYVNYKTNGSIFNIDNIYLETISIYINNIFLNIYNSFKRIGEIMFYDVEIIEAIFILCNMPYKEIIRVLLYILTTYDLDDSMDLIEFIKIFDDDAEDTISSMEGYFDSECIDISYSKHEVYVEFLAYKLLKLNNCILMGRL